MSKWEIKIFDYDNLPKEINRDFLSNNGCGKEYANYLVLYLNGKVYSCESDAIEPEDKTFSRDLDFIQKWITMIIKSMSELLELKNELIHQYQVYLVAVDTKDHACKEGTKQVIFMLLNTIREREEELGVEVE